MTLHMSMACSARVQLCTCVKFLGFRIPVITTPLSVCLSVTRLNLMNCDSWTVEKMMYFCYSYNVALCSSHSTCIIQKISFQQKITKITNWTRFLFLDWVTSRCKNTLALLLLLLKFSSTACAVSTYQVLFDRLLQCGVYLLGQVQRVCEERQVQRVYSLDAITCRCRLFHCTAKNLIYIHQLHLI